MEEGQELTKDNIVVLAIKTARQVPLIRNTLLFLETVLPLKTA